MPQQLPTLPVPTVATAPGKIILFGEHAVVYGRPAIAVPVSGVKAVCRIEAGTLGRGIEIVAPDLQQRFYLQERSPENPLVAIIRRTLSVLEKPLSLDLLLLVESTIPVARGLGSGAAVSTAIVKSLTRHFDQSLATETISDIVFEVERIHHGTPSGVDNSVIAFEKPIFFQKAHMPQPLQVGSPLTFVIGDTGIPSPTHKVVANLRSRYQANSQLYDRYFDEIGALVLQARTAIESQERYVEIGQCMTQNQQLLIKIGVSSTTLNRLVEAALSAGALGAKLSGAGWGGNMIALVQPDIAEAVVSALQTAGASQTMITELY